MKRVLLVLGVLAIGVGAWWVLSHRGKAGDTPVAAGSAAGAAKTASTVPAADQGPAHVAVTVSNAKGPLAGATVRLAGPDGDVTVAKTGSDGVAKADVVAGTWKIGASAPDHEPGAATRELKAGETAQIAIVLVPGGRTLTGTVSDASGGPVNGARVDAAKLGGLAKPSDAIASTTTGADGKYKLTVSEGQVLVAVSHADYAPQARYVDVVSIGVVADFSLVPGGVIEGIVRDEHTKEPVSGAHVNAERDQPAMMMGEPQRRHAMAGSDGHFRITGLRPGSYELAANADKRYSRTPTVVGLGVAEQVTDVVILVANGTTIRGTVVDEANAPVAGVDIGNFGRGLESEPKSDAKGAFVLEGMPPGHYNLVASNEQYVAAGTTPVELGAKDVDGVRIHVRRGGKVKGHVEPRQVCELRLDFSEARLDSSAGPLGGELPMLLPPVTTGPDGEFELGPASPITYALAARCPSGDQGTQTILVKPAMPDVVVPVTSGASIAGRVVDGKGKPIAAATVMAAPQTGTERTTIVNGVITSGAQALTAGDGTFELRGLAAADYRLRVLDRGRPVPVKKGDGKITLAAAQHVTGIELVIERSDGVIKGTVTGADGKPLADAWVSVQQSIDDMIDSMHGPQEDAAQSESRMVLVDSRDDEGEGATLAPVLTDASGHFELGGLPHVPWTVVAEAQAGKLRGRATKVTPDASITIQALGVTDVHGTVHVSGPPPESFSVELEGPTRAERTFAWTDGTFSFGRVDPGSYHVRVTSSAGNGEATVAVNASTNVDITLASNAIVTGKVVDGEGKPVAGVGIAVVPDQGDGRLQISMSGPPPVSGADGAFRVEAKAGKSVVAAMTPPRPAIKRGVMLEAGKTVDIGNLVVDLKPPPK